MPELVYCVIEGSNEPWEVLGSRPTKRRLVGIYSSESTALIQLDALVEFGTRRFVETWEVDGEMIATTEPDYEDGADLVVEEEGSTDA